MSYKPPTAEELAYFEMNKLKDDVRKLREWVECEGVRTNTCTFYVLGTVCKNCKCDRALNKTT